MKACSFFAASVSLFLFGCSVNHQLNGVAESSVAKKSVVTFSSPAIAKALAKTKMVGDSLTVAQRVAVLDSLIARTTQICVVMKKIGEPGSNWDYYFYLPMTASGKVSVSQVIDSGDYTLIAYDAESVQAGPDTLYVGSTFQTSVTMSVGKTDTTFICLQLERLNDFPIEMHLVGDTITGLIDSLDANQSVIATINQHAKISNGYFSCSVFSVKRNFYLYTNGKKYLANFDISKISGSIVDVPVAEVKNSVGSVVITFADNDNFASVSTSPVNGGTISSGSQNIRVNFNHNVGDLSQMPNLIFSVITDSGTLNLAHITAQGKSIFAAANLKPQMKYNCQVTGVIDEYGNPLRATYGPKFSFTTN
jgi:hypothetical protein